jgi:DNA-binding transcriptional MerR regulator
MRSAFPRTVWRVGELAAELGVNPRTIRYYERIGLLVPSRRTAAGYRVYERTDGERLRFILKAKAIGLSLREIRNILTLREQGTTPCTHVVAVVEDKLRQLDEHIRALMEFRDELATLRTAAVEDPPAGDGVCGLIERHEARHEPETIRLATEVLSHRPVRTP